MAIVPASAKVRLSLTRSPPWSGLASPVSTTLGTGPVRVTDPRAGTGTDPPMICTAVAVPGVPTLGLGLLDEAGGREGWLTWVADTLVTNGRTGAAGVLFGPSETPGIELVLGLSVARSAGGVAGLYVATDSITPATRHTAR